VAKHRAGNLLRTACLVTAILCAACSRGDDAEAIRALITAGATLAEAHDVRGLTELATEDFVAEPGGYDRDSVRGVLLSAFLYYGRFRVVFPPPSIEVDPAGDSARGEIHLLIVRREQPLPDLGDLVDDPRGWLAQAGRGVDLYRLQVEFAKDRREWRGRRVVLEPFSGVGWGG
jgi:hypothetical protein